MFLEEDGKVFVIENNRVVASFDKTAYYGTCPHPDCEDCGVTKYDIKKSENCSKCGTSMKVEFPSKSKTKTDAEKKGLGDDKQSKTAEFMAPEDDIEDPFSVEGEEEMEVPFANRQNESDRVQAWRQEQLMGMGYQDPGVADTRNFDTGELVDIRAIENLINQGATPEQALSILSKVANPQNLLPNMAPASNPCPTCGAGVPAGGVCPTCTANSTMNMAPGAIPPMPPMQQPMQPMTYGARVSNKGKEGTIVSMVPTMYGDTYGVKFDNGKIAEFLGDDLSLLDGQEINYNSPLEKITSEFDKYDPMPDNTLEELEHKLVVARSLNKEAKTMIIDPKLSAADRCSLDNVIVATSADLKELEQGKHYLREAENQAYLARAPKYQLDSEFRSWGSVAKTKGVEDISWVYELEDNFEPITAERLVNVAMESLSHVTKDQLDDDFYMKNVQAFAVESLPKEAQERFAIIFKEARKMKLEEPVEVTKKEAATVNYDEFPDAALFL